MDIDTFLDQETKVELSKLTKEEVKADKTIMENIKTIRDHIKNKQFHDAEKGYLEAREMYHEFIKEQDKVRTLLKEDLLALNKELVGKLGSMKNELLRRIKVIRGLVSRCSTYTQQRKGKEAHDLYLQIKALFANLPDIESEEKIALENDFIALYSKLLQMKSKHSQSGFKALQDQINQHMTECEQAIKKNNMAGARKAYNDIKKLYTQLPPGFLYEKSILHKHILEVHDHLVERIKHSSGKKNA